MTNIQEVSVDAFVEVEIIQGYSHVDFAERLEKRLCHLRSAAKQVEVHYSMASQPVYRDQRNTLYSALLLITEGRCSR